MTGGKAVKLWWINEMTAELVEMDVPADVAEAFERGQGVVECRDWPQRRFKIDDAQERLRARLDEIHGPRGE